MTDLIRTRLMLPPGSPVDRGPQWTDLWIREGSSDEDVLREVWIEDVYRVRGLPLERPTAIVADYHGYVVVDLGANIGAFTALICAMYPDVRVIAVEPEPENLELLRTNTRPWHDRVQLSPVAVGDDGGMRAVVGEAGTARVVHDERGEVRSVTMRTLIEMAGGRVALLKVDIEGAEYGTLLGADLSAVDRIVMETHGPETCPWLVTAPIGHLIEYLLVTHSVQVFGRPSLGGMLFANRYPD